MDRVLVLTVRLMFVGLAMQDLEWRIELDRFGSRSIAEQVAEVVQRFADAAVKPHTIWVKAIGLGEYMAQVLVDKGLPAKAYYPHMMNSERSTDLV